MFRMCVYIHFCFVENHLIQILEDGPLISEVVLSHMSCISLCDKPFRTNEHPPTSGLYLQVFFHSHLFTFFSFPFFCDSHFICIMYIL
jgi:hypothetical protein